MPEISIEALYEATINTFCYRDYRELGYIHFAIFKNSIEIHNPGKLIDGFTITAAVMINPEIKRIIQDFFLSSRIERTDILRQTLNDVVNNLSKRGMLDSGIAVKDVSRAYRDELRLRFEYAWDFIKKYFDKQKITFSRNQASEIEDLIKYLIDNEIKHLSEKVDIRFRKRLGPLDFHNSILMAIASARSVTFPKLSAELNYYTNITEGEMRSSSNQQNPFPDPRKIWVIHGRNELARKAMFDFLRAIGLDPMEWSATIELSGKGSPYIGEVLQAGFKNAQAVVAVISGDDEAKLREEFITKSDLAYEKKLTPQARLNVLFEAGMAFSAMPDRTILVEVGETRPFSDVIGRHIVKMDNSPEKRQDLATRLKTAGCLVNMSGTDWYSAGDFERCVTSHQSTQTEALKYKKPFYYKEGDSNPFCPNCYESEHKEIHLSGPNEIPGKDPFFKCHICDKNFQ